MVKIESASLTFATLSILFTSLSSLWLGVYMVRVCISMAEPTRISEKNLPFKIETLITNYGFYINFIHAVLLSFLIIALPFSIILIKGLLSKNSHLVKVYFIYGVTANTIALPFAFLTILAYNFKIVSLFLFGCFLHILILNMIRKTYLKLAISNKNQCCKKKSDEEQNTSSQI